MKDKSQTLKSALRSSYSSSVSDLSRRVSYDYSNSAGSSRGRPASFDDLGISSPLGAQWVLHNSICVFPPITDTNNTQKEKTKQKNDSKTKDKKDENKITLKKKFLKKIFNKS